MIDKQIDDQEKDKDFIQNVNKELKKNDGSDGQFKFYQQMSNPNNFGAGMNQYLISSGFAG